MKHTTAVIIALLFCTHCCIGQSTNAIKDESFGKIAFYPLSKTPAGADASLNSNLESKTVSIINNNGAVAAYSSSFFFNLVAFMQDEGVQPSPPNKYYVSLGVDISVSNISGISFYSDNIPKVVGVGKTKAEALRDAIRNISVKSEKFENAIQSGMTQIRSYYNNNCDQILRQAKDWTTTYAFDQAIFELLQVPIECEDCYIKSREALSLIYQAKINYEGQEALKQARNIWNTSKTFEKAQEVAVILNAINSDASCIAEAVALSEKVAADMQEDKEIIRQFHVKKEIELEEKRIEAMRQIGVAYGKNQTSDIISISK